MAAWVDATTWMPPLADSSDSDSDDAKAKTPSLQPWTVDILEKPQHPLLSDAQDIIEFFQAGSRQCKGAKFAAIAKERADHVAHMEKSPSFIQYKMCLGAHCSACAGVIEKRRASQTSWDPATILAPLQFNNGWFPFPHFRNSRDEASAEAQAARVAGDREPNEAAEEHPPGGTVLVPESDDDGTEPRSSAFAPVARGGTATHMCQTRVGLLTLLDLGRCSSCKKEGEVWAPKKKSGAGKSGVWCSCCWNDHLVEFNSDGEPDLVVLSVVPSGSQAPDLGRSVVEMCAASQ